MNTADKTVAETADQIVKRIASLRDKCCNTWVDELERSTWECVHACFEADKAHEAAIRALVERAERAEQRADAAEATLRGRTGHAPGLLQDDSRALSGWLANKPGAVSQADEAAATIALDRAKRDGLMAEMLVVLEALCARADCGDVACWVEEFDDARAVITKAIQEQKP